MKKKVTPSKRERMLPLLFIFLVGVLILILIVGNMSVSTVNSLTDEIVSARVGEYVNKIDAIATKTAGVVSFLSTVVRDCASESEPSREKVVSIISEVLMDNDDLLMVWTCWKPNGFDGRDAEYAGTDYHDETGRFAPYLVKRGENYKAYALHDYDDPVKGEYYQGPMSTGELYVSEPYYYSTGDDELYIYSVAMPIEIDGELCGVVGADVSIEKISSIMNSGYILEDGFLFTITAAGNILTYPDPQYVMRHYSVLAKFSPKFEQIFKKDTIYSEIMNFQGTEVLLTAKAYNIGGSESRWVVCGAVPIKTVYASSNRLIFWVAISGVILGIIVLMVVRYILFAKDLQLERDKAIEKELAKSSFLANMSHEIRTPLNAITGMTMIGKSSSSIDKKDYAFEKIEDASSHLLGVINDILDMSKIEANKFELSDIEFDFEEMLQKVVTVINFRMHEKKLQFSVFIDNAIPQTLCGDSQRLAQVITNLLYNAAKFTPENGCVRLDTCLINEENGICTLKTDISDTGIGIEPDMYAHIFNEFEQAENSTSRKYGGTGLGLPISKHIVEMMGGEIWLVSELGKGSMFSFTVKLQRRSARVDSTRKLEISRENIRVLVVDDTSDTRAYFKSIADNLGIMCDAVASGNEALQLIESGNFYHIFFVDWEMPGINGIELSRKINIRTSDQSVIIMISSFDWVMIEAEAKNAGVVSFLPKPLFPSSVVECINECLGQQDISDSSNVPDKAVLFQDYHVLLADDIEINRDIVKTILEPTQIQIDCAETGVEVLQMFRNTPERYDLIFMDVHMPEMDGYEATRQIRSLGFDKAASIPIIAVTANVFREDIERCMEAGMNDHIGKPFYADDMIEKLKVFLPPRQ